VPAPHAFTQPIATALVREIYRSIRDPGLVVADKENGGSKADTTNAGINAASGLLVLIIDADTVLEPDALSRAVMPFLEDPAMVAVGGNVAIVNGCHIEQGRIASVALPRSWLARFQIVEYMRAFLLFRLACASINAVVLISGAFGRFRRDAVIAVGGYDRTAIGEDFDLTIRIQRHFRGRGEPIRIAFDPNPLGWTQAPEDWRSLRAQRYRWRRGLLQSLWRYRGVIGRRRFGAVGLGALPFMLVFEGLGPLLEVAGYAITAIAAALGLINWEYFRMLLVASVMFGAAVTFMAVLLSDVATRRYMGGRDLAMLVAVVFLESFGYRQLISWWGCVGTVQAMSGKGGWGPMKRRAFKA
jgi:cellulose synthase/poly-beta-1,6-N-acetylglucosamine synthase-like glycosyltransferase